MQRVKRRKSESVRALEVMEELSHQFRRPHVCCIPLGGDDQKIRTGELQVSIWLCFVDHDLWTCGIQYSASDNISVHIMESHCPCVWSTNTPELKVIVFRLCYRYISEARCRLTHDVKQGSRLTLLAGRHLIGVRVSGLGDRGHVTKGHENNKNDGIVELHLKRRDFHGTTSSISFG